MKHTWHLFVALMLASAVWLVVLAVSVVLGVFLAVLFRMGTCGY